MDWSTLYTTISDDSVSVAQKGFLRNVRRDEAYLSEAPTLWDVTFQTAVAQAELEARDYPGAYHRVAFAGPNGPVYIETTRPELIPACVALIAHPDDERYQHLFGQTVNSPLYSVEVPVLPHPAAEPDKGAGIAMCCTFGDLTDVTWWRELQLPARVIIGRDGRILPERPSWIANTIDWSALAGKTTFSAREAIVAALRESGDLDGEPVPTQRKANFYEKGDKPLEIVSTRQWYIRNGGRDADLKQAMLTRGDELGWVPQHMKYRYDNWVSGLNGDWLISRQRFFGVPFPVWYALNAEGEPDYANPILATEDRLPARPEQRAATRLHRGPARSARRVRGGSRRHGHLGDVVAEPADRLRLGARPRAVRPDLPDGPQHPRPRDHPHLAVLPGGPGALREPLAALGPLDDQRLRDGPGPQEDEQVQAATSWCRPRSSSATARTPCAGGQPRLGPGWTPRSTSGR